LKVQEKTIYGGIYGEFYHEPHEPTRTFDTGIIVVNVCNDEEITELEETALNLVSSCDII